MMPFKTILIHAGTEQRLPNQLAVGVELASQFHSHLIGLALLPPAIVLPGGGRDRLDVVTIETHRRAFRDEAERMKMAFDRARSGRNFTTEWILVDVGRANAASLVTGRARAADLVISGQINTGRKGIQTPSMAEPLVVGSGRPVLLVPNIIARLPVGRRVLVAWNGTRESTKAAFDALPLLKAADYVSVLLITGGMGGTSQESQSAARLCQAFARHDISARSDVIALPDVDIGSALLSAVKAENADLLVMGCAGHPRHSEFTFGGASRHILHDLHVPVLMSH